MYLIINLPLCLILHDLYYIHQKVHEVLPATGSRWSNPSSGVSASLSTVPPDATLCVYSLPRNSCDAIMMLIISARFVSFLWSTMTSDFLAISALCGCGMCLALWDRNTFMWSHNTRLTSTAFDGLSLDMSGGEGKGWETDHVRTVTSVLMHVCWSAFRLQLPRQLSGNVLYSSLVHP